MLLTASFLSFVIPIQHVWALNITFLSPPTAAQDNTFLWTGEDDDPSIIWLRKQKLGDTIGATSWSDDTVQLDLSDLAGSAQIHFNGAGVFKIGAFNTGDPNTEGMAPIWIEQFTVSVNSTSTGAISGASSTPPVSSSSSVGSPPTLMPSNGRNRVEQPLIIGLTVGFGTLATIGATILYFHYRRRRKTDTMPPSLTPFSDTTVYNITHTDIKEQQRQGIGQRELEHQSWVDEQAHQTSPANNQADHTGFNRLGDDPFQEFSDALRLDIMEQKMQMLGQRERLERELAAYEQASQASNSGTGTVPDGINGSNHEDEIVQVSRRQLELLTQRIAALEAAMAPPDYSSRTSR
ncbi:hypothetical protein E1B28_013000 [Marasmius oreades]|uniref:Uncharacterized protein n=1 Tax=Marasmius oreades TaxID=181124 RepID=A0A9P7RPS4_9AGAR|nr:uncharacterized protein E1B28_013000 [Marasmius oreades]KAG7087021.1 hypothetical protein E1B28_013000 [Marasmius oreades]